MCPGTVGTWRLTIDLDAAHCSRTDDVADVTMGIPALSALFMGGASASTLAYAGRLSADAPVVARLDRMFRVDPEPHNSFAFWRAPAMPESRETDVLRGPRPGPRPRTSHEGPHRQLDQIAPAAVWGELVAAVFALPGVVEGISQVSPTSSRAVYLLDHEHEVSPQASLAPAGRAGASSPFTFTECRTPARLVLPSERGRELVALGWAEPHQYADFGTEFMIYGPRDRTKIGGVVSVIEESIAFARTG